MATSQSVTTKHNRYFPSLVLVAAVFSVPILAALLTAVFYLSPSPMPAPTSISVLSQVVMFIDWLGPGSVVILLGIVVTLVVWLLFALPGMRFATACGGRPSDYEALDREIQHMKAQYKVLNNQKPQDAGNTPPPPEGDKDHQLAREIRLEEVKTELCKIEEIMKDNGFPWVLGTGYVGLWSQVNEVDEAMIEVLPDERLIEDATYDQLRLKDSEVPGEEDLHAHLDQAIKALRPTVAASIPPKSAEEANQAQHTVAANQQGDAASVPPTATGKADSGQSKEMPISKAEAKNFIFQSRCTLHKFTNERWDGLVRARNQLMGTALLTGFFTYILVVFAILAKTPPMKIEQAMVFYFVGAIVGLFSRLYDEWNAKGAVTDDYGLTMARTLVTPLLSGVAALVGVFLVTMLSIALITPQNNLGSTSTTTATVTSAGTSAQAAGTPQPASDGTTVGTTNQQPFPKIATIYDLNTYPQNLVLAAFFGFLPSLVIGLLKKQTDKVESQIQSSSAGDQKQGNGDQKQTSGKGSSG